LKKVFVLRVVRNDNRIRSPRCEASGYRNKVG